MNSAETVEIISDEGMEGIIDTMNTIYSMILEMPDDEGFNLEDMYYEIRPNLETDRGEVVEGLEWFDKTLEEIGDSPERIRDATYDEGVVLGLRYTIGAFDRRDSNPFMIGMTLDEALNDVKEQLIEQRENARETAK